MGQGLGLSPMEATCHVSHCGVYKAHPDLFGQDLQPAPRAEPGLLQAPPPHRMVGAPFLAPFQLRASQ